MLSARCSRTPWTHHTPRCQTLTKTHTHHHLALACPCRQVRNVALLGGLLQTALFAVLAGLGAKLIGTGAAQAGSSAGRSAGEL